MKVKAIVFDFDGTLLNVNEPLKRSIEEVFKEKQIDAEDPLQRLALLPSYEKEITAKDVMKLDRKIERTMNNNY